MRIRIKSRPIGEVPEWVRDAWIGVELELLDSAPVTIEAVGVLSAPKTWWSWWYRRLSGGFPKLTGYRTDSALAVEVLGRRNPTAAIWWRINVAWSVEPGGVFLFDTPACEVIA